MGWRGGWGREEGREGREGGRGERCSSRPSRARAQARSVKAHCHPSPQVDRCMAHYSCWAGHATGAGETRLKVKDAPLPRDPKRGVSTQQNSLRPALWRVVLPTAGTSCWLLLPFDRLRFRASLPQGRRSVRQTFRGPSSPPSNSHRVLSTYAFVAAAAPQRKH